MLLVDDQELVRTGLRLLLRAEEGIAVVGEAVDGESAVAACRTLAPDVVLMDIRMPGLDGVGATRELLTWPAAPAVIMLTTFGDETAVGAAVSAGARGYLLKHTTATDLVAAIRQVAAGAAWLDPQVTAAVLDAARDAPPPPQPDAVEGLTPREREVLGLVAEGLSNTDICDRFVLSEATVKTHVSRLLMKTGARDRAALVALAYRTGFARAGTAARRRKDPPGGLSAETA